MNIFVTDECPVLSARNLDNRRLIKMQVETLQLFAYAMKNLNLNESNFPISNENKPYKATGAHLKHPCTLWLQKSQGNFQWLLEHLEALMDEYEHRFNVLCKSRANIKHIKKSKKHWPAGNLTAFQNSSMHKQIGCPVFAYRLTIINKVETAVAQNNSRTRINYGNRPLPSWYEFLKVKATWQTNPI